MRSGSLVPTENKEGYGGLGWGLCSSPVPVRPSTRMDITSPRTNSQSWTSIYLTLAANYVVKTQVLAPPPLLPLYFGP